MTLLRTVYEFFPPKARERIKLILGAHGHGASHFDGWKARDHARGKKRLDRVAETLAPALFAAGVTSLRDRNTLEFGAGYAPTEALIFSLLGARKSVATDYNAIARLDQLVSAARTADRRRVLELLSPFADGIDLEQRLDGFVKGDVDAAKGKVAKAISYVAPHDMSVSAMSETFDLIHSVSVFEHLPPALVIPILKNLVASLSRGGKMITEIDLRDHKDFTTEPLSFLSEKDDYDPERDCDRRGNRLRRSEWLEIFRQVAEIETRQIYAKHLAPSSLPAQRIAKFRVWNADDMLVSWIGLASVRP